MKTIVLAVLLAAISSIDLAQAQTTKWFPLSNEMYAMRTRDNDKIVLTANIDTNNNELSFHILDLTGSLCKDADISKPASLPNYKINGKYVRILSMCINGSQLVTPETPEGRKFFLDQIMSGKMITIETNFGPTLHFKGALPPDLLKNLKESENAM